MPATQAVTVTDPDLLQFQAFENELAFNGRTVTVKLLEGQEYEITALVGDEEVGVVTTANGTDEIPARLIRLPATVQDGDETITLEFIPGAKVVIEEVEWAFEKLERRFNFGVLEILVARSKLIDASGATNRRTERYGAGGRLRSRY